MSVTHSPDQEAYWGYIFNFFNMNVCCVFSLESPHRGDSNEYTIYLLNVKKENPPKLSQICRYGIFSKGLKNEFDTAVVDEPSVFEPLKFYCICKEQRDK